MITVKFLTDDNFRDSYLIAKDPERVAALLASGGYVDAATVDTDDLENAYAKMNNGVITDSWTLNPPVGLTPLLPPRKGSDGREYGNRSMSVGDVAVFDGETYVVASFGFERVG